MLVRRSRHLHAVALGPLLLDAVECGGIDTVIGPEIAAEGEDVVEGVGERLALPHRRVGAAALPLLGLRAPELAPPIDRKSTRLNSSHTVISYAVFCLKK